MKKILLLFIFAGVIIFLTGCNYDGYEIPTTNTSNSKGRCLEYQTEYRLDCGFFVSDDSFCKERKYDVCIRWEEQNDKRDS